MNPNTLNDAMTSQLSVEWERFRKALAQAGDIGPLTLEEWRIVPERDRRGLPPAVSVMAIASLLKLEKSGLRGQSIRLGEETKDSTLRMVAEAQAGEIQLQDPDHSEVYSVLAYHAGKRLGLNDMRAAVFGDAMAYLLTGWMQTHVVEARYPDKIIYEFKKVAGGAPEGGFLWSNLQSLTCRRGFKAMTEAAGLIGTAAFR